MNGETGKFLTSVETDVNLNDLARSLNRKAWINKLTLFQIEALKREAKHELKKYDDEFSSHYGRLPSNDEKEPMRHIYETYAELRTGIHHKKGVQRLHRLRKLKTELRGQLKEYDNVFAMSHGGRAPTADEREPVREIYEQYCTLKEELSRIESVVEKTAEKKSKNKKENGSSENNENRSKVSSPASTTRTPTNSIDRTTRSQLREMGGTIATKVNKIDQQDSRSLKSDNLKKPLSPKSLDSADTKSMRSRSGKPKKLGEVIMLGGGREEQKVSTKKTVKPGEVILLGPEDGKQTNKDTAVAPTDRSSIARRVTFSPLKKFFGNKSSSHKKKEKKAHQENYKREASLTPKAKDIKTDNRQMSVVTKHASSYDSDDFDQKNSLQSDEFQEKYVSQFDQVDDRDDIGNLQERAADHTRMSSPRSQVTSPRSQAARQSMSKPTSPRNLMNKNLPETIVDESDLAVSPRFQNVRSDWAVKDRRPRHRSFESHGTNATSYHSSEESDDSSSRASSYNTHGVSYATSRATSIGNSTAYSAFDSQATSVGTSYASSHMYSYASTVVSSTSEEEGEEEHSSFYSSGASSSSSSSEESEESDVSNLSIPTTFQYDRDKGSIVASQLTSMASRTTATPNPKSSGGWLNTKRFSKNSGKARSRKEEESTISSIAVSELQIEVVRTPTIERQQTYEL